MKHNIMKHLLTASLVMSVSAFTACSVDADLCDSSVHPHEGRLNYTFDWGGYVDKYAYTANDGNTKSALPDSMYIIATRVVNFHKTAMVVGSGIPGKGNTGYFVFNPPKYDPIATTPDPTPEEENPTPGEENPDPTPDDGNQDPPSPNTPPAEAVTRAGETSDPTGSANKYDAIKRVGGIMGEFPVAVGSYKFVAFNMDTASFDYKSVVDYMVEPTTDKKMQDIFVEYRPYDKTDDKLGHLLKDWQDYNSYAPYVQTNIKPVFFDTIPARDIVKGRQEVKFKPMPVTQNIDIYFTIKKEFPCDPKTDIDSTFAIDYVVCEMAGIPYKVNLLNGYIAIEKTRKVMFETELLKKDGTPLEEDTEDNKVVRVHANIDVPTIVENSTSTMYTGPGIMQVMIMTHGTDPGTGERKVKKLQGKINLYNTLKRAKLIKVTEDGRYALRNGDSGVLDIVANIVVSGGNVIKNNDNNGGLDVWKDYTGSKIIVDI